MGDLRFPEDQVRGALRLDVGDRFDFIDWQEDRDRLDRFYQRPAASGRPYRHRTRGIPCGVALTYTVEAGPETHVVSLA